MQWILFAATTITLVAVVSVGLPKPRAVRAPRIQADATPPLRYERRRHAELPRLPH
jgi:hypothetical protein